MGDESKSQPLLPQISMRWYFVIVVVVGSLLAWVLTSDYQKTLSAILLFLGLASSCFLVLSSILFLLAYAFGSVEKIFLGAEEKTQSPFAHEAMPPQIIPPVSNE